MPLILLERIPLCLLNHFPTDESEQLMSTFAYNTRTVGLAAWNL